MKYYWVKTHWIMKWIFPHFLWDFPTKEKTVYLTFDDGPTPKITDWVLSQLEAFQVKATFFCIGNNISSHPEIFKNVVAAGHAIGNHTFNHVNGWHIDDRTYFENVIKCEKEIEKCNVCTNLFRPPYGKLTRKQSKTLREKGYKIVMWDILSADFDNNISRERCLDNVLKNLRSGSIIIFHDSIKAFQNLEFVLPKTLVYLKENGFKCEAVS